MSLIRILHLSDIHLGTKGEARKYLTQLEADLKRELKVDRLEYMVLSGDIASNSTEDEYDAAFELVDGLIRRFSLEVRRVVVVPGNHDLNWDLAEEAYHFVSKRKLPEALPEGHFIPAGDAGVLVRDEEVYKQRFARFSEHFFTKVYDGRAYPLDYTKQAMLHLDSNDKLCLLTLNSSWEIDHYFTDRASINMYALSHALDQLHKNRFDDWLKIAVWHHPVTGPEMMNNEFLQLLTVDGFQVCMHGHIHEAKQGFDTYDSGRGLHIVGAGTFGTPLRKQAGIPLQYNLLILNPEKCTVTVETRKKEKPDGAWSADPRWGDKNNPSRRHCFKVSWGDEQLATPTSSARSQQFLQEVVAQGSSDDIASHQPAPPSYQPRQTKLKGAEEQVPKWMVEQKNGQVPPSIIITIGVTLLFAAGIIMGLFTLRPSPPPTLPLPNTITFKSTIWPEGRVTLGEHVLGYTHFSLERQEYQIKVMQVASHVSALAQSDVSPEEGLCLSVDMRVSRGRPAAYGVIFHSLSQEDSLYLKINEQAGTVQLEQLQAASSKVLTKPEDVEDILNEVGAGGWHSIRAAIRPERVDVWLNSHPVLGFEGENLSVGAVGVFAASDDREDSLPAETSFRNFEAALLTTRCLLP